MPKKGKASTVGPKRANLRQVWQVADELQTEPLDAQKAEPDLESARQTQRFYFVAHSKITSNCLPPPGRALDDRDTYDLMELVFVEERYSITWLRTNWPETFHRTRLLFALSSSSGPSGNRIHQRELPLHLLFDAGSRVEMR